MTLSNGLRLWLGAVSASVSVFLTGCGSDSGRELGTQSGYDYVTAVRPLAYDNAYAACSGHSLASLALEFEITGATVVVAARDWARRNQLDGRLRDVSFRGCRDGLRQTAERPVLIEQPSMAADEIDVYIGEYANCLGLTSADVAKGYGLNVDGMTTSQAVRARIRVAYAPAYRQVAAAACLAAMRGEPPRYGS